jgi:hypothetical protein
VERFSLLPSLLRSFSASSLFGYSALPNRTTSLLFGYSALPNRTTSLLFDFAEPLLCFSALPKRKEGRKEEGEAKKRRTSEEEAGEAKRTTSLVFSQRPKSKEKL